MIIHYFHTGFFASARCIPIVNIISIHYVYYIIFAIHHPCLHQNFLLTSRREYHQHQDHKQRQLFFLNKIVKIWIRSSTERNQIVKRCQLFWIFFCPYPLLSPITSVYFSLSPTSPCLCVHFTYSSVACDTCVEYRKNLHPRKSIRNKKHESFGFGYNTNKPHAYNAKRRNKMDK